MEKNKVGIQIYSSHDNELNINYNIDLTDSL